jgi:hypothetical protein
MKCVPGGNVFELVALLFARLPCEPELCDEPELWLEPPLDRAAAGPIASARPSRIANPTA